MGHECLIIADDDGALVELCGITILERLLRSLQRCDVSRAFVLSNISTLRDAAVETRSWARPHLDVILRRQEGPITIEHILAAWPPSTPLLAVVRADTVFDMRLLQLLFAQKSTAALVDSSVPEPMQSLVANAPEWKAGKIGGASMIQRSWAYIQSGDWDKVLTRGLNEGAIKPLDIAAQPIYSPALRRNLRRFWFRVPAPDRTQLAESVLLDSVQKGSQDLPALVHAPIERFLVSHLCRTQLRPDYFTIAWAITAVLATIFFAAGYLVSGLACALIVGILDGLDGKQARIKVETTKRGKLEHRLDSFFEVGWPTALAYHFHSSAQLPSAYFWLFLFILVQALDGIAKGGIYYAAEKSMKPAGRFDRVVRFFGGRRNVYVWIFAVCLLLGIPAKSLIVMTWWEGCTAALDLPHAAFAMWRLRKH